MGATTFVTIEDGESPDTAFDKAVEKAKTLNGTAGYTGTIAEKTAFTVIGKPVENMEQANDRIDHLFETNDHRIDDKWGPAGCIELPDNKYIFFGWASC